MKNCKLALFSAKAYDKKAFGLLSPNAIQLTYFDCPLNQDTVDLAANFDVVCVFVNDVLNQSVLVQLAKFGITNVVLRCAGFNNVDIDAAKRLGIKVARVPSYSPQAVAEHAVALMMTLNRKTHKAYNRTKENNFNLNGLIGFNISEKTVGIIGTGQIGLAFSRILTGFGVTILGYDVSQSTEFSDLGGQYVDLDTLLSRSDIISLHCPLNENTKYLIDAQAIERMKKNVMLLNTGRGGLIDSKSLIAGLKSNKIGYVGLDVYEQEAELFFDDHSNEIILDDHFERLLTFPNVIVTGHQGFFTDEAVSQIVATTLKNIQQLQQGEECPNQLC